MFLDNWLKKWLLAVMICLLIIAGCGTYLLYDKIKSENESDSKYVINQVRLQVNSIMLYLEQNSEGLHPNLILQNSLQKLSKESDVRLIVAQLDGTVIFNSAMPLTTQKIDLKTSLHYDLYSSRVEGNYYKIAFPIVNETNQIQIGNAIFTMPASKVFVSRSYVMPLSCFVVMIIIILMLVILLFQIRKKIKYHVIQPIRNLKQHSEAILKGNYEQKVDFYGRTDEIGALYTMFDQMRLEIMHLSLHRDKQEKAQKELISNISHDLKTPITTVKAYTDAIIEGVCSDTDTVMEYVEVIQINIDKMARLVEDLLLHALQDLGEISITLREQYSKTIFSNILKPIGHYIRTSGIVFNEPHHIPNVLIRAC